MRTIEKKIGIIILAAGESSRLGEPKQLLIFQGKTLIRRAVETAIESKCFPVAVILGANFEKIEKEIEDLNCLIFRNENWRGGMSSSIKTGLEQMREIAPEIDGVVITLCDQPFVKSSDIKRLVETFLQTNKPIIASVYKKTVGVPALFSTEIFEDLKNLSEDKGARHLIAENIPNVEMIALENAVFDIDTSEDYERAIEKSSEIDSA